MKTCPTCHQNYEDNTLRFCLEDGTPLVAETASGLTAAAGADATLVLPGHSTEQPPAAAVTSPTPPAQSTMTSFAPVAAPPSAAPSPPVRGSNRNTLLLVAAAVVIGGSAIAVAVIVTRGRRQEAAAVANEAATPSPSASSDEPVLVSQANPASEASKPTPGMETSKPTPTIDRRTPIEEPKPERKPENVDTRPERVVVADAPPPPAPTPLRPRAPVSGGVLNGKAINLVKPAYPPAAKAVGASGAVQVQVTIDENGSVISAAAISGHPLLRASAVQAARSSRFSPTMLSGTPVKVTGVIVYNFVAQ